jgi:hypothetical protein
MIHVAPDFLAIGFDQELLDEMNNMLETHKTHCMFSYDTKFELGDFFLSVFVGKHMLLSKEPMVPIFYMFHDRKLQDNHETMMRFIKKVKKNSNLNYNSFKIFVFEI